MTAIETLLFLVALYFYYGIIGLRFLTQAGYKTWQALIPFYNIYIMTKVIERPWWWVILAILPVVGNVMMVVIFFELMHMYRLANVKNTVLGVVTIGLYFAYLSYSSELKYQQRDINDIRKYISEGFASIVFAIIAATLIRSYTFEAFTIPTPSMEKSLMVGDFLFVSKIQYGSRLPMTPFSVPMMHNRVPFTSLKSFTDIVQFPYLRLPKISEVKRNDPVVFNYPVEDHFPVDKREHYVKRCLALPGDTLEIKGGEVYINGERNQLPERADRQFQYYVQTNQTPLSPRQLKEEFDINALSETEQQRRQESGDAILINRGPNVNEYIVTISDSQLEAFKQLPNIREVIRFNSPKDLKKLNKELPVTLQRIYQQFPSFQPNSEIFPNPANSQSLPFKWTRDNYGPIYMPKAGNKVELTINNYHLYRRIIEVYEGHDFKMDGHRFFIDGVETTEYQFAQDYYWMMGDNRHNSLDSRYWGFVPADHIVGKPVFIWMSYDKYASGLDMIRFDRVFTLVNGEGKPRSYFWPFIILVAAFYGYSSWKKKKKQSA